MTIQEKLTDQINRLNAIGAALSKEKNIPILLEKILSSAKELTHADGGSIYIVTPEKKLRFEIVITDSLQAHFGGTSSKRIPFQEFPLFLENGESNDRFMVAFAVNHKKTIHIQDAYAEKGFDFSGTREFDEKMGYRTRGVLTIPMRDHEGEVIAALQLLNPKDPVSGKERVFLEEDINLAESLASQAGIALTNQLLIFNLRRLFEALVSMIAEAIDAKSPVTGKHGKRVPVIALLLAQAVSEMEEGIYRHISFTEDQLYELELAAFLHDCGKITTPAYLVEKRTKLEGLYDKIGEILARLEVLKLTAEKELLEEKLRWIEEKHPEWVKEGREDFKKFEEKYLEKREWLAESQTFVQRCNRQLEPITEEAIEKLEQISQVEWKVGAPLLTDKEVTSLSVKEGNLTESEIKLLQNHVVLTYRMLSQLPYPKGLKEIPEIASSHHERMDGKGYPRGLHGYEMSIRSRILVIADIFEALSAPDRPYKQPYALSEILKILRKMAEGGHIDPNLLEVFLKKKVYLEYAKEYLMPYQIDCE